MKIKLTHAYLADDELAMVIVILQNNYFVSSPRFGTDAETIAKKLEEQNADEKVDS